MDPIRVQGRTLSAEDIAELRALIAGHPQWRRTALSRHLCQVWDWRNGAGRIKDMAARTLLLKLEARGLIELPPRLTPQASRPRPAPARSSIQSELDLPTPPTIDGPLARVQPVSLELVQTLDLRRQVSRMLAAYHYRGFRGAVGENVQYVARAATGRELALLVFGAAAWQLAVRDRFLGWSASQRAQGLRYLANQQRFLLLPGVRVPQLASHLLALATRRLAADWQARYGHPVWLVETFVERQRFAGTAYRAAGWSHLGATTGRTRQDRLNALRAPLKDVWVCPLHPRFRDYLTHL